MFDINDSVTVNIANVAIQNGQPSSVSSQNNTMSGGGIYNSIQSSLTLTNTIISDNRAAQGGGIYSEGYLTIADSMITNNVANTDGGGLESALTTRIVNSTIANNIAHKNGGGILNFGLLSIDTSTISDNTAQRGGGLLNQGVGGVYTVYCTLYGNKATSGGGLANDGKLIRLTDSIIAGDHANTDPDVIGDIIFIGPNLIQDTSGARLTALTSFMGEDWPTRLIVSKSPHVAPLQKMVASP